MANQLIILRDSEGKEHAVPVEMFEDAVSEMQLECEAEAGSSHAQVWTEMLFDSQERLSLGNPLSIYDALTICEEQQIPLPNWLNDSLKNLLVDALTGVKIGKRGRSNAPLPAAREALKTFVRRDTVRRVRLLQELVDDESTDWNQNSVWAMLILSNSLKSYFDKNPDQAIGGTLKRAIEISELSLRGTFSQGSYETMRKAWASANNAGIEFYCYIRPDTLEAFGLFSEGEPQLFGGFEMIDLKDLCSGQ